MIASISGTVISANEKFLVIDTGGIGYKVHIAPSLAQQFSVGSSASLWIYTAVREDAIELFGFDSESGQELFELLLNVSGIGPRSALAILSVADMSALIHAIKTENAGYLTQVSGIGKKTAEKIILELSDKVEKLSLEHEHVESDHIRDAVDALLAMGYHERAIREVLRGMDVTDADTSRIIREALQIISQ
jgi:Holliday junction DNA helicase RuvA